MSWLAHYGVLGMKWGHRNTETLARYARDGKRKSYKDDYDSFTVKKGSSLYRITNPTEAVSGASQAIGKRSNSKDAFDPSRPKYVTATKEDYQRYGSVAPYLPSVYYQKDKAYPVTMRFEATKKLKVASGESTQKYIMDTYGDIRIGAFEKKTGGALTKLAPKYDLSQAETRAFIASHRNKSLKDIDADLATKTDQTAEGRRKLITAVTAARTVGSSRSTNKQREEFINHFRDLKYDAVIDPEDYKSPAVGKKYNEATGTLPEAPMIIIEPRRSMKLEQIYRTFGENDPIKPYDFKK